MNTENRITLKEMAKRLNRCPKTFRKYLIEYKIPHICLGRDMLFNAVEVENYLSNLTLVNQPSVEPVQVSNIRKSKTKQNSKNIDKSKNRYASLLGLS
jgi:excisionase family DNA binding protein